MADEPKDPPSPPKAAADKPASSVPGEPLKGEVSRTDSPSAGVSAAPVGPARTEPPAPKPENPEGAVTAATSEVSSATGQVTAAEDQAKPAAAAPKPAAPVAAKPAVPASAKPSAPAAAKPPAAAHAAPAHAPTVAPPSGPTDPPPPADKVPPAYIAALQAAIPGSVEAISYYVGDWTIIVPASNIVAISKWLRETPDAAFDLCTDLTATDWPPRSAARFDIVYCLYSIRHRHRIRVKAKSGDQIASVTPVWPACNWLEREVYDMFGVTFTGHPDLRRILMPLDWQGFPQRKDYPLEGPGELLMENPIDWLKLRQAKEEAEIE